MALSTYAKEQDNFLRYAILIVDHSKEALQDLIELNLRNNHLTFEEFLDQNQHEIYHLCYDSKCCQCHNSPPRRKRVIYPSQLELLFDKHNKLSCHTATNCIDFCCSKSRVGISMEVLDITLARSLLVNCCLDVFWSTCLTAHRQTLEQFLNLNKHIIYHLWKNNQKCCQCPPGFIFPRDYPVITENEWRGMFSSVLLPCLNDRKRTSTGTTSVCSVAARPGINETDIRPEIQGQILKWCCSVRKSVEKLVECRNMNFGHASNAKLSDVNFTHFSKETEECILAIARVCGTEFKVNDTIYHLHSRPIDARLCSHYQNILLENINRNETISENVKTEHFKTRNNVSYKLRKLGGRIDSLETSSIEIKQDVKGLRKLITDHSKRSQLIRETLAEIDNHRKDQTYTLIKAVTACVQMLDNSKVLILSGREGSGKSKNSLEILRQMKEKHPETDVIKLRKLSHVTYILEKNASTILLFDDVFGRTSKQFCENYDRKILDILHSYISLGVVSVIFVMRNAIKHECKYMLSSYEIFCDNIAYLDLNSKEFELSLKEKENLFINYCKKNEIKIIYREKSPHDGPDDTNIKKIKVSITDKSTVPCRLSAEVKKIIFNARAVQEILRSNPYHGFPQCCRLFTKERKFTILGAAFFKYPFKTLLQEIENIKMDGIGNDLKGLKYVILVYILLNQASLDKPIDRFSVFPFRQIQLDRQIMLSIDENDIDVHAHTNLFNECYNRTIVVESSDIKFLREEMTFQFLTRNKKKIYFQHQALQDSVLISYIKINPKAIIPMLSIDHIVDIVLLQSYMEQEDEIVIKISRPNYHILAKTIIVLLDKAYSSCEQRNIERLLKSKLIKERDNDLIYEMILFIHNATDILSEDGKEYFKHFFSLYVLRNIGEIDNSQVTVNHSEGEMVISVVIGNKKITFSIDPSTSLIHAFQDKYENIVKWLIRNTKHSLLYWKRIWSRRYYFYDLHYVKIVLRNVENHDFDLTSLFAKVLFQCKGQTHIVDWMLKHVNISLIRVNLLFYLVSEEDYVKSDHYVTDVILLILKKITQENVDTIEVITSCFEYLNPKIMKWVLDNFDHELLTETEIIDLAIENYDRAVFFCEEHQPDFENIFVQLLQIPGIKCSKIGKLIYNAFERNWFVFLKFLFKLDITILYYIDTFIGKGLIHWNNFVESADADDDEIFFSDDGADEKDDEDDDDKAEVKISEHFGFVFQKSAQEKFLLLYLHRINPEVINLDNVMNHACHFGHLSPVLWLLKNKPLYQFDMRNVMNKVCFHGDFKMVRYLFKKYSAEKFDYKTAMIKACRSPKTSSLRVCKWLWKNIDHSVFDMKTALNNASRYDNCNVIEWILADVDTFFDLETAMFSACEHGNKYTVQLLLDKSDIKMFDIQSSIRYACQNEHNGFHITKLLLRRANKSTLDMNAVFLSAYKCINNDIVQWLIETFVPSISDISNGNNIYIKNHVDINRLIDCILDMGVHEQEKERENASKSKLLMLILQKSDPQTIYIYKLLSLCCKMNWVDIYKWIFEKCDNDSLNVGEIVNIACQDGAFKIVKWSLKNIDLKLLDIDNVMNESCAYGWLECCVLIQEHLNRYVLNVNAAMGEACTYDRVHIAEWLFKNFNHQRFDLPLLLKEACRNGWNDIFLWLVGNVHFQTSNIKVAIMEAMVNGEIEIVKVMFPLIGRCNFDIPENTFCNSNNEEVVTFLLHHFDSSKLDLSAIIMNACKCGWTEIVKYTIDKTIFSSSELNLFFMISCENGETEIVKVFAEKFHYENLILEKAMLSVCIKGWDEIAVLLLDKFEYTRLDTANALIEACRHGELDVVQAILRKVDSTLLDVKTAINEACKNHIHEELVLWILENIDREQVELKNVKIQAIRHQWRKVYFALTKVHVDTEAINQVEKESATNSIIFLE